jgi:hypothetical protein
MAYWYDRDGEPIETWDAAGNILLEPLGRINDLLKDYDYRKVAKTKVDCYEVSTVWLGVDHSFGESEEPVIFETMVFVRDDDAHTAPYDEWCWRYSSEEEALRGHGAVVAALKEGREPELPS